MGGYGSIQNSLKNNKALLRSKRFFNSKKNISDKKELLLKGAKGELEFVTVSQGKLSEIKSKIQEKANRRSKVRMLLCLLVLAILVILVMFSEEKMTEEEAVITMYADVKDYEKNLELYEMYLEEGAAQLTNNHFKNATYFYEKALSVFPKDSLATAKLKEINVLKKSSLMNQ